MLPSQNLKQLAELTEHFASKRPVLYRGVAMLLAHHQFDKSLREDAAGIWLLEQRHQFNSGLRLLTLIGVISPLLGLLGTVLGLIEMFKGWPPRPEVFFQCVSRWFRGCNVHHGSRYTDCRSGGCGFQLLNLWADRTMAKLEHTLNYVNLWLECMTLHADASLTVVTPQEATTENL